MRLEVYVRFIMLNQHAIYNFESTSYTYRIHGIGIFTNIWLMFIVNVGKYTNPMDPMGYITTQEFIFDFWKNFSLQFAPGVKSWKWLARHRWVGSEHKVLYMPGGAGFLPSPVVRWISSKAKKHGTKTPGTLLLASSIRDYLIPQMEVANKPWKDHLFVQTRSLWTTKRKNVLISHHPFIYEISRGAIGKKFLGIFHLGREIWPPPTSSGRFSKHVGGGVKWNISKIFWNVKTRCSNCFIFVFLLGS